MDKNAQLYRSGRTNAPFRTGITHREATELRRLYAELPDAAAAARMALKTAGRLPLSGEPLSHYLASDARVTEIINRIQAIVSAAV